MDEISMGRESPRRQPRQWLTTLVVAAVVLAVSVPVTLWAGRHVPAAVTDVPHHAVAVQPNPDNQPAGTVAACPALPW